MKKQYRLVEIKYTDKSFWVIEERGRERRSGVFRWHELEDEGKFTDYDKALARLKEYRKEADEPPAERKILDV